MLDDTSTVVFLPMRPRDLSKYWGVLCPQCNRVHAIGKYVLMHVLEGTNETLIRMQRDPVTCRFCGAEELYIPQFIQDKAYAEFFATVNLYTQTGRYCEASAVQSETIRPEVFAQILRATRTLH